MRPHPTFPDARKHLFQNFFYLCLSFVLFSQFNDTYLVGRVSNKFWKKHKWCVLGIRTHGHRMKAHTNPLGLRTYSISPFLSQCSFNVKTSSTFKIFGNISFFHFWFLTNLILSSDCDGTVWTVHPKLHWQNIFAIFMPVLVANQKCDWCQFHWLRGYLDVAMAVILLLT